MTVLTLILKCQIGLLSEETMWVYCLFVNKTIRKSEDQQKKMWLKSSLYQKQLSSFVI